MACGATMSLKRSLEFDPIHSRDGTMDHQHKLVKRRRLMPQTAAPTKQHQLTQSPFLNIVPKMTGDEFAEHISAQIKRLNQRRRPDAFSASSSSTSLHASGVYVNASGSETRLPGSLSCGQQSAVASMSTGSVGGTHVSGDSSSRQNDVAMFTLKQVGLVCERMMKEREEELQEEYDKVLTAKLSEQYDAFLKFNQDQLHRKFGETAASYVS